MVTESRMRYRGGPVLVSILLNVMYDGVLRLKLPKGTHIIAFADDIAVVIKEIHLDELVILPLVQSEAESQERASN